MKKNLSYSFMVVLFLCMHVYAGKGLYHFISLPLIEGAGIYTSVKSLTDDVSGPSTKAASITNLALLGTNGALGLTAMLLPEETSGKMRTVHKIVGYTVAAASIWLAISGSVDEIDKTTRYVSYGYGGLTLIPVIMFSF